MTGQPDIAAFLLARIEEEEQGAQAATQGRWFWPKPDTSSFPQGDGSLRADQGEWQTCGYFCRWSGEEDLHRGEPGKPGHEHRVTETVVGSWGYDAYGVTVEPADAVHIARWDPARVLADCAARRAIVEAHSLFMAYDKYPTCTECGPEEDVRYQVQHKGRGWPCRTLCLLAQPYADHSDFKSAWRLESA